MPLQVSTRCRYGLRLMTALAMNYGNGITLMKDVSKGEGISEKYLGQIIIPLKSAGFVSSQRGAHGGYSLARPPADITARDIVEAIEGKIAPVPCVDDSGACARASSCAAAGVWRKLAENMESALSSFTLEELARRAREARDPTADYSI